MTHPHYDIAIVGLGAMGAMTAWRAAAAGARVLGFEQFEPAHAHGSSHGGSRIFRKLLFEGADYVPLVRRAEQLWLELERYSGRTLLTRCGGLCIGPDGGPLISEAVSACQAGGVEYDMLSAEELRHRYPQHALLDGDIAVYEPSAGILDPESSILAAIGLARASGAELHFGTVVDGLHADDTCVRLEVGGTTYRCSRAVVASGAWFTDLVPQLPLRVQRSPLVWFTGPDRQAYRPERFPVFVRESGPLDGWGIPDVDGGGVKIGAGPSAPKPWLAHADDNDYPVDERDAGPAESFCAGAFPGLDPHAVTAAACMNSKTPDNDFVIGVSRHAPRLVLAGGFSGHGFKHAAAVGEAAARLALDGGCDIPLDRFSPDRFEAADDATRALR